MIVSNSSPLIYLAKIQQLHLLQELFEIVLIPLEVKQEVVDEGKRKRMPDAFLIEREIQRGWIKVEAIKSTFKFEIDIHSGEKAAIMLAKEKKQKVILLDEAAARTAAKMVNLEPRGIIYVLLLAITQQKITFDQFLHLLTELTRAGFRLHEEVYAMAVEEARKISKAPKL